MKEKELVLKMNIYHHMSWWTRTAYIRARIKDNVINTLVIGLVAYFVHALIGG